MIDIALHVMAHYHYKPKYVMNKLTLSQVITLFNGMAAYITLTNGGDPEASPESEKRIEDQIRANDGRYTNPYYDDHGQTVANTSDFLKKQDKFFVPDRPGRIEDLPTDILDLVVPPSDGT